MRNSAFAGRQLAGLVLCKPLSFSVTARTYLTQATIPSSIHELAASLPKNYSVIMSDKAWESSAKKMLTHLQHKIKQDECLESQNFLEALAEFAKEDKCRGLVISNMPPHPTSQMLVNSILYSLGYGYYSNQFTQNPFKVSAREHSDELTPHTDQPGDERLGAFALNAEMANGKVPTHFMSPYVIMEQNILTEHQIDILSQPSFFFSNYPGQEAKPFSIISQQEGKLRMNFDFDINGFRCDFKLNTYPEKEVKQAVIAFNALVCDMFRKGQGVDTVALHTGMAVIARNDFHRRPELYRDLDRTLTRTYGESTESLPLVLQFLIPSTSVQNLVTTKTSQSSLLENHREV